MFGTNSRAFVARDHDRQSRAGFDRSATAAVGVSFFGFFQSNAKKTIF
jgi:hypothetical protein